MHYLKSSATTRKTLLQNYFISDLPITLIGHDSRYAYDLNRIPGSCIYERAWEKAVWKRPLTNKVITKLQTQHQSYYQVLNALVETLEQQYKKCCVFDVHSYNYQRICDTLSPVFNIGTHFINKGKWQKCLTQFNQLLISEMNIHNIDVNVECDLVFYGRGYQAQFIREHFSDTLLIPLEIKKVYMDELTGEPSPLMIEAIAQGLQSVIYRFISTFKQVKLKAKRQQSIVDKTLLEFDRCLFQLSRKIDILNYVNPINFHAEEKKFFQKRGNYEPKFRYRQLKINPFEFREKLYHLPINRVSSPTLRQLYTEVIDALALDMDLLTSISKDEFFYNSLRIYGEPSNRDIANATFLLHAPDIEDKTKQPTLAGDSIIQLFQEVIHQYGIDFTVKLSDQMIAKAMVDNNKREVVINKNANFTDKEL